MPWPTLPADFSFAANIGAADINAIRSAFAYLAGFETDTDPSGWWGAASSPPSIGNGTGRLAHRLIGQRLDLILTLEAGGTTNAGSGAHRFTLPGGATIADTIPTYAVRLITGGIGTTGRTVHARKVTSTTFELVFDAADGGGIVGSSNWGSAISVAGTIPVDP